MSVDLIAQFQSKIQQAKKEARSNYFLVAVEKIGPAKPAAGQPQDPDAFLVAGKRMDTNEAVVLRTRKSTAGQHLPIAGSVMRADKATRIGASPNGTAAYQAEYFHAYGAEDLCIHGMVRAGKPYSRQGQTSASVQLIDIEKGGAYITQADQLDAALLAALKPWAAEKSVLSHDARGKEIWTENGRLGAQPFVMVRMMGGDMTIPFYGLGAVDQNKGTEEHPDPRLPTDEEILANVHKNPQYQTVLQTMQHPEFAKYGYALVPGVQFNVGRSSLSGGKENYLGVPAAWDWELRDQQGGDASEPKKMRGWRGGYIHLKESKQLGATVGRLIVVDAAPSSIHRLTPNVPKTKLEQEVLARAAAGAQAQQAAAPEAAPRAPKAAKPAAPAAEAPKPPATARQAAPQAQAQAPAAAAAAPIPSATEQPPIDAYADMDMDLDMDLGDMAEYLMDMEGQAAGLTNNNPVDDNDTDNLLAQAAERAQRRTGPRM